MFKAQKQYLSSIVMASIGAVLFSGKAIIIKYAYRYGVSPEALLALRMLIALPLFWCVYWFVSRNNKKPALSKTDYLKLLGLGFIGYFFSSYLDFLGLQFISVGLERIILYLTPTIVILISYFFLHKKITRLQWYAMIVGYLGVILVFLQDAGSKGENAWLGTLLVLGSACMYAAYLIAAGEMVNRIGSMRLVTYATSVSALFSAIQIGFHEPSALFTQMPQVYWLSLVNASICTVIPMFLVMLAIQRVGSSVTAQAGILGPLATILMGWYFLDETMTLMQVFGMALVVAAMWLLVRNRETITN
ncbi:DMT family transporter [Polynucleobacter sp. IMCC 29146]|uniref:DMT family transporter n=1 Tax=Polynucleobacter sp. IMCC 29146 TaxID=2780953 RepID=UPI001F2344F2|nr:DMT family transporter [Polynucleobacter sp. IMCC 29146]MCE7529560.1 DMT family transporter [Polynucleobacter sp. IMCC 29146]